MDNGNNCCQKKISVICRFGSNFQGAFILVHCCMLEIRFYPKRITLAPNWSQLFSLIFGSLMWCDFISHQFSVPMYPVQGLFSGLERIPACIREAGFTSFYFVSLSVKYEVLMVVCYSLHFTSKRPFVTQYHSLLH